MNEYEYEYEYNKYNPKRFKNFAQNTIKLLVCLI